MREAEGWTLRSRAGEMVKRAALALWVGMAAIELDAGHENPDERSDVAEAIRALGAPAWTEREAAQARLAEMAMAAGAAGDAVLRQCLDAWLYHEDPEVSQRAEAGLREAVLGKFFREKKGFLGVSLGGLVSVRVEEQPMAAIEIVSVVAGTAAEEADIRNGDKILRVDDRVAGVAFGTPQLVEHISAKNPGDVLKMTLWSGGKMLTQDIVLGERPTFPHDPPVDARKRQFFKEWVEGQKRLLRESEDVADEKEEEQPALPERR